MCLQHYQSSQNETNSLWWCVFGRQICKELVCGYNFLWMWLLLSQFTVTIKCQIYLCLYVLLMLVPSLLGISSSFVCLFRFNLCFWPSWNVTLPPGQNKSLSPFAFPPHFFYNFNIVCYLLFFLLQLFILTPKAIRLYAFRRYGLYICFLWHFLSFPKIYLCIVLSQHNVYRICPLRNTDLLSSHFDSSIYVQLWYF